MVTWTRMLVAAIAISILSAAAPCIAQDVPQPPDCPEGYICLTLNELAERTAFIWQLQAERTLLKARARRFGFTVGCGVGVAGVINEAYETQTAPAMFCGGMYGWRF